MLDLVVAPVRRCRLCCRVKIEIERPPTPGGFSFALLPLVDGLIFAPSESHKNDHTKPLFFFRPYHYITHQTNATQRATESDRTNHQSTTAGAEARTAAPTERQKKTATDYAGSGQNFDFTRQNFTCQNFKICGQNLLCQIFIYNAFEILFFKLSHGRCITKRVIRSKYDFLLISIPEVVLH